MATYLLDTTVIIDALNDKRNRRQLLRELTATGNILACSPINITEVYAGLRPKEEEGTARFLHTLQLYPMTWPVIELAGLLKRRLRQEGPDPKPGRRHHRRHPPWKTV